MIKPYPSSLSLLEVFRRVESSSRVSFFLDSVECHPPDQSYSYLGADPFLEVILEKGKIRVSGEESGVYPVSELLPLLRRLFKKYGVQSPTHADFFTGGAVGFLGYELASSFDRIKFRGKPSLESPLLYLGFYRDLIVYDHRNQVFHLVTEKGPQAQKAFKQLKNYFEMPAQTKFSEPVDFHVQNFRPEISKDQFKKMVRKAKDYIAAGDIYQANLSQRFRFEFEGAPLNLYEHLREINPSPFSSYLKVGDFAVASSSPERLIKKQGVHCETRPMAGTRPRFDSHRSAEDLETELLTSEKERAEHIMLVDLERNDLGRVCDYDSIQVEDMMKIERYSHVIHIVSKITGRLQKGKDSLDVLQAMFPGGTITGCPKIRCMEIIDELEPVRRGLYTGSIGYLGFNGDLDLNIVIRTLVLQKNKGTLQVGAGIVHDSDPACEYEETLHKGEALVQALVQASL